ncbi:hypothetical protein LXG23DRAFT_56760 [Yarrowia lipolytica]|nr:hypothetical protein LXG23DRAFT_56760 [Yarrowia lipolytica]
MSKNNTTCICAQEATCSCGLKPAQQCVCSKAPVENAKPVSSTCSCGMRPANHCTCSRQGEENSGLLEGEVDFTNLK